MHILHFTCSILLQLLELFLKCADPVYILPAFDDPVEFVLKVFKLELEVTILFFQLPTIFIKLTLLSLEITKQVFLCGDRFSYLTSKNVLSVCPCCSILL